MEYMSGSSRYPLCGSSGQVIFANVHELGQMADPAIMEFITDRFVSIDMPVGIPNPQPRQVFNDPDKGGIDPEVLDGNPNWNGERAGTEPGINFHSEHTRQIGDLVEIPACQYLQLGAKRPHEITPRWTDMEHCVIHD
jgi:hypothetical protein